MKTFVLINVFSKSENTFFKVFRTSFVEKSPNVSPCSRFCLFHNLTTRPSIWMYVLKSQELLQDEIYCSWEIGLKKYFYNDFDKAFSGLLSGMKFEVNFEGTSLKLTKPILNFRIFLIFNWCSSKGKLCWNSFTSIRVYHRFWEGSKAITL